MRSFIFSLLLYSSTLLAYSEESYIDEIAFINAAIISIVPVINFIQLKMNYNLQYNGSAKEFYFLGFAAISAIASELCMLMKENENQSRDYKSRSLRPQVLKSSSAYGIILESMLLNRILLQDIEDLNCTLLLSDSIIYPVSIGGNLKLSIGLKRKNSTYDLTHLESVYGMEDDSWFETLCISY
ncbi:hypothetical protein [Endozoicomonas numazuensis]|uniref:Uncharacterized protein n=1 Tax=Endozoicomonas numazuensis TaxID=1137799 RepID=A0A081NGG8_9GAMM|nr:hypothetical protein [Endozoicomonas numazuensis]KEQ17541.1 hypothetical protein GZ78_17505 [Endozoicomonas numazuensis]